MKKPKINALRVLMCMLFLAGCTGLSEHELRIVFSSRPSPMTVSYEHAEYIVQAVPAGLPFSFAVPPRGELLGSVEDAKHTNGTILLQSDQSANAILEYFTNLFTDSTLTDTSKSHSYQVFFPPEGNSATFCSERGVAVILEIFDLEEGLKDVRLHYTMDHDVIASTTCGQPVLEIEDFPFPRLVAPPNSSVLGGGGGGGGGEEETTHGLMGYSVEMLLDSSDDLEFVHNHYRDMLSAEGWILLNQNAADDSYISDWDFGFYKTRSWLARLIVSAGETPNQYKIELRAISP
jgi:hypothetical protein